MSTSQQASLQEAPDWNRGRAAMIYMEHGYLSPALWKGTPEDILRRFEDRPWPDDPVESMLLIFEDLGANWVDRLKRLLAIPDYVFDLHTMHPDEHILGKAQVPLGQDPARHFILNYRQPLPFKLRKDNEDLRRLKCTANRTVVQRIRSLQDLKVEDMDTAEQLVTFWSSIYQKKRIALLLVDPCPDLETQTLGGHNGMADPCDPPPLLPLSATWRDNDPHTRPRPGLSLFDELVSIEEANGPELEWTTLSPLDWTFQCRRLVLAKSASVVQSALVETWKMTGKASTGAKDMASLDFEKLKGNPWSKNWKGKFFAELWELREDLELIRYRLDLNRNELKRIAGIEVQSFTSRLDNPRSGRAEVFQARKRQLELDMQEWDRLAQMNDYAFQLMNRTTQTYVQVVSATNTQFANAQAQNSRKLTGFAAVFVPASLCAAVLAIPSLTPEAKSPVRFWVFWAVSVPLAIILGLWFLSPIPNKIVKWRNERPHRKAEEEIQDEAMDAPPGVQVFGASAAPRKRRDTIPDTVV